MIKFLWNFNNGRFRLLLILLIQLFLFDIFIPDFRNIFIEFIELCINLLYSLWLQRLHETTFSAYFINYLHNISLLSSIIFFITGFTLTIIDLIPSLLFGISYVDWCIWIAQFWMMFLFYPVYFSKKREEREKIARFLLMVSALVPIIVDYYFQTIWIRYIFSLFIVIAFILLEPALFWKVFKFEFFCLLVALDVWLILDYYA